MTERIQLVALQMIPFLMAIVFHEVAHALVAKKYGDTTAEDMGRLTLNPVPHIDPIGTLLFPIINMMTGLNILFGWAKPVPINFNRLKPYKRGLILTSIAGPIANILMGILAALVLVAMSKYIPADFYLFEPLTGMAMVAVQINFALALFNLIPLPPLDGSKVIEAFLSYNAAQKFERLSMYSFFILLGLLWSGLLSFLSIPILYLSNWSIGLWRLIFGV